MSSRGDAGGVFYLEPMLSPGYAIELAGERLQEPLEKIIGRCLGAEGWPRSLPQGDLEDLVLHLIEKSVVLAQTYSPRDVPGTREERSYNAVAYLLQNLRWRARDWNDAYRRRLAGLAAPNSWELAHGDDADAALGLRDGSHGAPGEVAGDRGDPGLDALRWLLESGDRTLLREIEALGLGPPPGARGRSPAARRRLDRLEELRLGRVAAAATREPVAA